MSAHRLEHAHRPRTVKEPRHPVPRRAGDGLRSDAATLHIFAMTIN
ncbi:hypothetical protein [Streptomyces sp. NPDC017435]